MQTQKIETLTQKQINLIPAYRDKWLKIGLSIKPGDEKVASEAIAQMYEVVELEPPQRYLWFDSPLSLILEDCSLYLTSNSVLDPVWTSLRCSVLNSIEEKISNSIYSLLWGSIHNPIYKSVFDSVRYSVWNSLSKSILDFVDNERLYGIKNLAFGSHNAHWLGFFNYLQEVLEIKDCQKVIPLCNVALHCNWLIPRKEICLISRKPIVCQVNSDGFLHAENSAAIAYPGGMEIYAVNGFVVPKDFISFTN